jgi:hypothetical protein
MSVRKSEFEEALTSLCEHKEEYDQIFRKLIREAEFKASRYKDQQSYETCINHKKLYNKLKYVLYLCDSLDEAE